ncbi:BLUF domain-containing protein [Loktanella sp. SALINAS62]|uniref:BLUF domain-containing protein n=1 Tax=Loktanella sp. SALINAS62 TaxID=2706124 RepID=UPI001B8CE981|nr:BLUF domain-containing protein [Loktanella sp. SALINAS62]MBS1302678.1 BLUF domain-containing protein [Loktanella sp. SALINAS62]
MLFQLAYVSLSTSPLDEMTLSDILKASQRNNARDKITGVLMYHDEIFFQVLEGEQSSVEDCYYKRISHDPRHKSLSLMWADLAESPAFSDWAMGYVGPDEVGRHTKNSFQSLSYLKSDEAVATNINGVALALARSMFSDFKKRG